MLAHEISVENRHRAPPHFQELHQQDVRDGRLARAREAGEEHREALFLSGIRPDRAAGRISLARYQQLADNIKLVLASAIKQGGTTLRDFVGGDGRPGYFAQQLLIYGRSGQSCKRCGGLLRELRLGQRSSVYCVTCQR